AFNDPPMNFFPARRTERGVQLSAGHVLQMALAADADTDLTVGIRAGAFRLSPLTDDLQLPCTVELAEISGSDTFLHVDSQVGPLVAQFTGVHHFELGAALPLYVSNRDA